MPFTTISRKILCEDLLPLFPHPSLPNASSMTRIPTSISYYEVLTTEWALLLVFNIYLDSYLSLMSVCSNSIKVLYFYILGFLQSFFLTLHRSTSSYWLHIFSSTWRVFLRYWKLHMHSQRIYAWRRLSKEGVQFFGSCAVTCSCWLSVCRSVIVQGKILEVINIPNIPTTNFQPDAVSIFVILKMCCWIQDSQIVLLLNKATNTSESAGVGCMIILQASDLPYVSISRSAYIDVWRLQELKVSHAKSVVFIVYGICSDIRCQLL